MIEIIAIFGTAALFVPLTFFGMAYGTYAFMEHSNKKNKGDK